MECSGVYLCTCLSIYQSIYRSIDPSESIHLPCTDTILIFLNWNFNSSYSVNTTDYKHMTKSSTSLWRVSLMVSFRSVFFPSSNGQESSAGLAMKHKCSSASSCSQKRHTRWHVSWPLRSEALRAVSSAAVRISACVPLFPTVTPRAEKPHARSLPSPPRRHIRHLRGISWVGAPPSSIRPGSLPLSHFRMNPIRVEIATLVEKLLSV